MTGGLIQIVAYGTADIFLTGMPQITFFKLVYRRYTNFAIENLVQTFSGTANFGNKISCTLDRVGDLVNKMYLQIVLPTVLLPNPNYVSKYNTVDANEILNLQTQYSNFKNIINYIFQYYRELNKYISTINQNVSLTNLFNKIKQITAVYYTSSIYNNLKRQYNVAYNKVIQVNQFIPTDNFYDSNGNYLYNNMKFNNRSISDIDIIRIITNYNLSYYSTSANLITGIKTELFNFKNNIKQMDNCLFNNIKDYQKNHLNYPNYKFSWIKNIGHQLIKNITVEIGGQVIDRHTNDWFNIWNELSLNSELQKTYDKLIGNIDSLTTYDYTQKNTYTLNIPLLFWFNKYISGSLPLVFLKYSDIRIELELNDIKNLIFTDAPSDYNFQDTVQLMDINLNIDYIYLDIDERSKFAQSPQEYLIEVVQNYNYQNIASTNVSVESFFINSVKELFWVAQSNNNLNKNFLDTYNLGIIYSINAINNVIISGSSTSSNTLEQKIQIVIGNHIFNMGDTINIFNSQNYNGNYKIISVDLTSITIYSIFYKSENDSFLRLVNFVDSSSSSIYGDINPFLSTTYTYEQYNRFQNYDSNFTNFVQPYTYHSKTPADGINIYSYCLMPEEYQPSGTSNLSSYKFKSFLFKMHDQLINYIQKGNDTLIIKTYALGYNILSFKNGMAGLVFNI
jgi:hypothetical protein